MFWNDSALPAAHFSDPASCTPPRIFASVVTATILCILGPGVLPATADDPVPGTPTYCMSGYSGNQTVSVYWMPADYYATDFPVERSDDDGATWTQVGDPGWCEFWDDTVERGVTYQYRVSAHNDAGTSAAADCGSVTVPTLPGAPTAVTITPGAANCVISWTGGGVSYRVWQGNNWSGGLYGTTPIATGTGETVTIPDNGCPRLIKIQTFNSAGEAGLATHWLIAGTATELPAGPLTGVSVDPGDAQILAQYTLPTGAAKAMVMCATKMYDNQPGQPVWDDWDDNLRYGAGDNLRNTLLTANWPFAVDDISPWGVYLAPANAAGAVVGPMSGPYIVTPAVGLTITPPAPGPPIDGSATWSGYGGGKGCTAVEWMPSDRWATSYVVERSAGGGDWETVDTPSWTEYFDTDLDYGTTYSYRVSAANAAGTSDPADCGEADVPDRPSAPTNLTATAGTGSVALSWTAVTPATGQSIRYAVYRALATGQEAAPACAWTADTTYTDSTAAPGVPYYYTVTAIADYNGPASGLYDAQTDFGESVFSAEATATPTASSISSVTAAATATANGQITLSWLGVTGATSYDIYRGTTAGGEGAYLAAAGVTGTTYSDTVTNDTTYYYKIAAVDTTGPGLLSPELYAEADQHISTGLPLQNYYSGTNVSPGGAATADGTTTLLGVVQSVGAQTLPGQTFLPYPPTSYYLTTNAFDSSHFASGTTLALSITATGQTGQLPLLVTASAFAPVYNRAYAMGNCTSLDYGAAAMAYITVQAAACRQDVTASSTDTKAQILDHLPAYTAFYIYTHGADAYEGGSSWASPAFLEPCGYPTDDETHWVFANVDPGSASTVQARIGAKSSAQPPYNFVELSACDTAGHTIYDSLTGDHTTYNPANAEAFGVPDGSVDRGFAGFASHVEDSQNAAAFDDVLWEYLGVGEIVGHPVIDDSLHEALAIAWTQYQLYEGEDFYEVPDPNLAVVKSYGDPNTTLHGTAYGAALDQWYR